MTTTTPPRPQLPQDAARLADLIVRPGRHPLTPGPAEDQLAEEAGAASGRIGKDLVTSPAVLRLALTAAQRTLAEPLLVSVNQEGGRLNALDWPGVAQLPGGMALGAADREDLAELAGAAIAGQLRAVGLTWNLAPVVDLGAWHSASAVGTRSFGTDPVRVAALAAAWVRGLQSGGVAATAKHFPGLGGVQADPHHSAPVVDRLVPGSLLPFRAVAGAGAACVMVGSHTVRELDDRPALASPRVLALLRDELGFTGVAVSENLSIPAVNGPLGGVEAAAVAAVAAGLDLVMLDSEVSRGHHPAAARAQAVRQRRAVVEALAAAVATGLLPLTRLEEAAARVLDLHHRFGLGPQAVLPDWVGADRTAARAAEQVAEASVTALRGGHLLPLAGQGRPVAVVRVPDTGQRRADSARHAADAFPAAIGEHRQVLPVAFGQPVPPEVGAVVVYGYDTRRPSGASAAAAEASRLAAAGSTVVQVAFGDPDELADSSAHVLIAAYSPHPASAQAVAGTIWRHGRAPGRLPVGEAR
ncbi:glycoside hydrolase family 3 N-terminal domain-containing protein [Streptacidiphilus jiangxiensis]|uniref:beta-N-acetylhexosaminidase n=1 Tax=Streptacidiphilus jiangxiensis TaxID=235985 RepID=A0A1H8AAZ4_STRJI|nr:glycoside hydrolase family 3 N-terminal domain-containing protein [Streptacidiphilus jiangxiensis]SEM67741.1 beta-glucosidase [Streptacidiphilus jiangxiensis]